MVYFKYFEHEWSISIKQIVGIWWIFTKQIFDIKVQHFTAYEIARVYQMNSYTSTYGLFIIAN